MLIPVILAGGTGTRLWPLSRAALPKQFIHFPEQNSSLFQNTLARLAGLPQVRDPIVVCNTEQRFLVAEQLRQLGMDQARILLEPVGRNTAPAVAIAALSVLADLGDD
jgi:mannose-1-phosphate guanylyltransferase